MRERFFIQEARKDRWWKIQVGLFHRKINRRKYYGVHNGITKYRQVMIDVYQPFFDDLETLLTSLSREGLDKSTMVFEQDIGGLINTFLAPVRVSTSLFEKINHILLDAFRRGGKRVFNRRGDIIETHDVDQSTLNALLQNQIKYLEGWDTELRLKIRDELVKGVREGKSFGEMKKGIMKHSRDITENRALCIARSEIVKASSEGTLQGLREAGIEDYLWLSARDNRVCLTCKDIDRGKSKWGKPPYHVGTGPMPVTDTHPNCRCVIVADI